MPKARMKEEEKNPRGVFQRPPGSGVWWINYYEHGKQHREKVGRKSDAIDLYRIRRAAIRLGEKLPPLKRTAPVMVSDLVDLMLAHVRAHRHKDIQGYESRGEILRKKLGSRDAKALTNKELETWLDQHTKTPATFNRYKALVSLCYREGIRAGKVTENPARQIPQRKEPRGRLRFLSREEYAKLHSVIAERFPEHLAEFVLAVHTGMRRGEMYSVEVGQFDRDRRAIDLDATKNGDKRTVHLNPDALQAIESVLKPGRNRTDRVFEGKGTGASNRFWFQTAVSEAGIPYVSWHGLRHTFCSWLAMAGATTREIMEAAGHRTMIMAARYSHLSPQHTQSVVDRIALTGTGKVNMHQNMHQRKSRSREKRANG